VGGVWASPRKGAKHRKKHRAPPKKLDLFINLFIQHILLDGIRDMYLKVIADHIGSHAASAPVH
jgi:hypothetical protein